jgi:hypothetical protein
MNIQEVLQGPRHANSPYGVNRATRRNHAFRLRRKKGRPKVQIKGIHGKRVFGIEMAMEQMSDMFRKIEIKDGKK